MKAYQWLLPVVLGLSLASVHVLPDAGDIAESAVRMELPFNSREWILQAIPPSEAEIGALAKDTEFAKAICNRQRPGEFDFRGERIQDRIDLSIVLSGHDLNNSIHRPERCMPAQGHNILSSKNVELTLANGHKFTAKRLLSVQSLPTNEARTEFLNLNCVTYYFFVGHDRITHDHLGRTFVDMKDRLLRGMDQRWAYVSTSMWFGELPWIKDEVTEAEADEKLQNFLRDLAEKQIRWEQIRS